MKRTPLPHGEDATEVGVTYLSLTIPGLPSSLNAWGHWRKRDRERQAWAEKVGLLLLAQGLRKEQPVFRGEVSLTLIYSVARKLRRQKSDLDNFAPKHLIDGLMGYVFKDDSQVGELVQRIIRDAPKDETHVHVRPLHLDCCDEA